jgi:hypothetical protein
VIGLGRLFLGFSTHREGSGGGGGASSSTALTKVVGETQSPEASRANKGEKVLEPVTGCPPCKKKKEKENTTK